MPRISLHATVVLREILLHSPPPSALLEFNRTSYSVFFLRFVKLLERLKFVKDSDATDSPPFKSLTV